MKPVQFATIHAIATEHISRHRTWIEETLGVPLAEALQLHIDDQNLAKLAAQHVLPQTLPLDLHQPDYSGILSKIRQVGLPENILPSVAISKVSSRTADEGHPNSIWATEWHDCPVALQFESMKHPVIFINVPYQPLSGFPEWQEITVVRRDSVAGLLALIEECLASHHTPTIHYFGGEHCPVPLTSWEDVVMCESATKLLRRDFESFFERERWFRDNKLPFRRGYLLHGPPGNGKTSVIRAMLSHPGVSGHAINLVTQEMDDDMLQTFFQHACRKTPALVILEDIDRLFFSPGEEHKPKVSLQQLLNCLDGVGTQDGMIVVATANHPEVLDTAILRRPGRFDRVIEFGNPEKELRTIYLRKMCPTLLGDALEKCSMASEGLSFAQLRESYILGGQTALEEDRNIMPKDVIAAIALLQAAMNKAEKKRTQKSGFDLRSSADRESAG